MSLTTNLISYYKLDSNSNDSVGSNNGTDTSISYANAGIIGNDATLNGSTSYITLPNIAIGSSFSWNGWIKRNSNTTVQYIYVINNTGNAPEIRIIHRSSGGNMYLDAEIYDSGAYQAQLLQTQIAYDTNWHMVTLTATTNSFLLYDNGTQVASDTSGSFNIGGMIEHRLGYYSADGIKFNGQIDEVGIWSRALSSTEVTALYNGGAGLTYPFSTTITLNVDTLAYNLSLIDVPTNWIVKILNVDVLAYTLSLVDVALRQFEWIATTKHSATLTPTNKHTTTMTPTNKS